MYKLLIADDEQIVIDSLTYIINKNFTDTFEITAARSGREAVEKAELVIPDIIFMDINMPGINGLDAIRELRGKLNDCIFIILSAFDQFEFAKDALNLGVTEYLLKPVSRDKIIDVINKSISKIQKRRTNRKKELHLKEKIENILPILENGFIYSLLFLVDNNPELENYKNILDISEDGGYIMTIELAQVYDIDSTTYRINLSIKNQAFYPYLKDILKSKLKCYISPAILNRIIVFIPAYTSGDEYKRRLDALNVADYVYSQLLQKVEVKFNIGIGRAYSGFSNIYRSYEESLKAIRFITEPGILHIMDIPSEKDIPASKYPTIKERLLLEKAALGDTDSSLNAFNYIFEWLNMEYSDSIQKIKAKLIELMILISRLGYDYNLGFQDLESTGFISELQSMNTPGELNLWCTQRIEFVTKGIKATREKKQNYLILMAKEYIEKNYNKDITLEDVSREVNISPYYFSRLFKTEMGENFIDYLTTLRINTAKNLMRDSLMSVKEICYEIGYGDPNYFSRIFKRIAGMTPTEYKESIASLGKDGVS